MFSANMTGQIQRVVYDNGKADKDAMIKVSLAVSKQYAKDPKKSKIFPLVTIFGYDAQYLRKYAGVGQIISIINAEADYYENDRFEDDKGNHPETVSFKAGKVWFPKADVMKALVSEGVAEEAEGGDADEEEDEKPRRRKKKTSEGGKSRSQRRRKRDDDEEEEEKPARRKKKSAPPSKKKKAEPEEDYEDDYEDDFDEEDDDYFDEDED